MKKLLTLFTLLLCVCSGAWADPTVVSIFDGTTATKKTDADGTTYKVGTDYTNAATGFKYKLVGHKADLVDVSEYTNHGSYNKAIRNGGSSTSNYIQFDIPSGYTASLDIVYGLTGSATKYFALSTSKSSAPNGSNGTKWNASVTANTTLYSAHITELEESTTYYLMANADKAVFANLVVTLTPKQTTPTLTGAWKRNDVAVTEADVIVQGDDAPTMPTFTVGATSGTPEAADYTVTYTLKDGYTSGIFAESEGNPTIVNGQPSIASTTVVGSATIVATLYSVHTEDYEDADPNEFEYTVTINAPAAPTFSPVAGAVASGTAITMTSPDGGEIWYTTSGEDPTESNKTVYDAEAKPTITDATTIKAIARVNGYSSAVTTANYTVAVVGTKTWDFTDEVSAADLANLTDDDTNWLAPSGSELRWKNKVDFSAGEAKANGKTLQEFEGLSFSAIGADNFRWMPGDGTGNGFLQMNGSNYSFTISGLKDGDVVTMSYQGAGSGERSMSSDSNASLTSGTNSNVSNETIVNPSWTVSTAGDVKFTQTKGLKIYSVNVQRAGVETVDVTVTSANYKAYNTTMATDFTMTDGVQAFIVSEATAETIKLEEIQMAPSNTPVILKTAGDYTLYEAIVTPAAISGNKLQISNGTVSGDGSTKFALGKKNDVAGFYLVGNGVTIPTSYVEIIGGTAKDFIPFMNEGSETDGIKAVQGSEFKVNGEAYNLAGQRVGKDYKGLVIINGKKVIRK